MLFWQPKDAASAVDHMMSATPQQWLGRYAPHHHLNYFNR